VPYLTLDPRDLRPGDRIPDLSTDGPTVAAVADPVPDEVEGHVVPVTFTEPDSQGQDTRDVSCALEVWVLRPDTEEQQ